MKFKLTPIALVLAASLAGCGGGSSSGSGSDGGSVVTPTPEVTPTPAPGQLSTNVTVIDDYLANALVWLDLNGDFQYQANEPSVRTSALGTATLNYSEQYSINDYHLVAKAIAGETIDTRTGKTISRDYYLTTPKGKSIITPLTSLAQGYIEQGQLTADAINSVCQRIGQNQCDLFKDYVAEIDGLQLGYARAYMNVMPSDDNQISFSLALDRAAEVDAAINNWLTNNNLKRDSINWQLIELATEAEGVYRVDPVMAEDYMSKRAIALSILSGYLDGVADAAVVEGLEQDNRQYNGPCSKSGSMSLTTTITGDPNSTLPYQVFTQHISDHCTSNLLDNDIVVDGKQVYQGTATINQDGKLVSQSGRFTSDIYNSGVAEGITVTSQNNSIAQTTFSPLNQTFTTQLTGTVKMTVNGKHFVFKLGDAKDALYYPHPGNLTHTSGSVTVYENTLATTYEIDSTGWWMTFNGERIQVIER